MLQQTQVATVIPYFYRFMDTFPTIKRLAEADSDKVLAHWSGLGYYARARNLHRAAQLIMSDFAGVFPHTLDELISLPGIGLSTAGAIIAQSFNQFGVILDGNVKRVLTRYLTLKPTKTQTAKSFETLLWEHATYFTPKVCVADYTQAIMDLGATICTRTKPKCLVCPLSENCQANLTETQAHYPLKPVKKIKPVQQAKWLVFIHQSSVATSLPHILLSQRPSNGIWGGLWSFPEYPPVKSSNTQQQINQWLKEADLIELSEKQNNMSSLTKLAPASHVFTHFKLEYETILITLTGKRPKILASQNTKWYNPKDIIQVGLPSPVTKVLNQVGFFTHDNKHPTRS